MSIPDAAGIRRAQAAANDGLEAAGRRARTFTDPAPMADESKRARDERLQRARLEVLDAGRSLIELGRDLEQAAEDAKRAGVLALRLGGSVPYSELGELLGLSTQGAHKRYRNVEAKASAQRTIDDELEVAAP